MEKHVVKFEDAEKVWIWLNHQGGIAVWKSLSLSDPGKSWTTPVRRIDGTETGKPHWSAENTPSRVITDPEEILVKKYKEFNRFHVALRVSGNGLMFKCTDASSERIKKNVSIAGEGAYYTFDYVHQEAVIMQPFDECSLTEWYKYFEGRSNDSTAVPGE